MGGKNVMSTNETRTTHTLEDIEEDFLAWEEEIIEDLDVVD